MDRVTPWLSEPKILSWVSLPPLRAHSIFPWALQELIWFASSVFSWLLSPILLTSWAHVTSWLLTPPGSPHLLIPGAAHLTRSEGVSGLTAPEQGRSNSGAFSSEQPLCVWSTGSLFNVASEWKRVEPSTVPHHSKLCLKVSLLSTINNLQLAWCIFDQPVLVTIVITQQQIMKSHNLEAVQPPE